MSKKRRLSPTASSSPTPAPTALPPQVSASTLLDTSPDVLGPSRYTPVPRVERTIAKAGTIVPGSGDGQDHGDECFLWTDLPMNKQGFRYIPCAPSPNPSPSPFFPYYRTLPAPPPSPPVHISWVDRSSFLRISPNTSTVSTDRGFRSARTNVGVREGSWFYEVVIERGDGASGSGGGTGGDFGNAHVRLGWGRREANLDAPVGMDGYGYGIRDVGGEKVHLSRPRPYGRSFKTGDVVGCLITLPRHEDTRIRRKRVPIRYKGQLYFEMDEYGVQKEMEALVDREGKAAAAAKAAAEAAKEADKRVKSKTLPPTRDLPILLGSKIEFYLNGESLGTAFEDLYDFSPLPPIAQPLSKRHDPLKDVLDDDGTLGYYPMVSCFGRGKVRCNFGPDWQRPPNVSANPLIDRWEQFRSEELVLDERDEAVDSERIQREMEEKPAVDGVGTPKKRPLFKKKRKGTDTPGPESMSTPGTPAVVGTPGEVGGGVDVKMEEGEGESVMIDGKVEGEGEEEGESVVIDGKVEGEGESVVIDGKVDGEDGEDGVRWE